MFLAEEYYGQRGLVGYSPQGHKESDMTEATQHTHTHTHVDNRNLGDTLNAVP